MTILSQIVNRVLLKCQKEIDVNDETIAKLISVLFTLVRVHRRSATK